MWQATYFMYLSLGPFVCNCEFLPSRWPLRGPSPKRGYGPCTLPPGTSRQACWLTRPQWVTLSLSVRKEPAWAAEGDSCRWQWAATIYSVSALCQAEGLIINPQSQFILSALQRPDKKRNKEASQTPSEKPKYFFSFVKNKNLFILQKVLTPLLLSSPTHFDKPELKQN